MNSSEEKLYRKAYFLSLFTIFYNIAEGLVSLFFGYEDETLTLFGFGADSFIEVMSGLGIAIMIVRIRRNPGSPVSRPEFTALRITGTSFYLLSAGLLIGIIFSIIQHHKPETTTPGIIISIISILVMIWLTRAKKNTGRKLNSEPVIADSKCTLICVYMSLVLLASSLIYEISGFAWADIFGAAGLTYFSFNEGRESFEKAKNRQTNCLKC